MSAHILTKALRDGSPLTIHLIPEDELAWWLEIHRNGELMGRVKNTPFRLPKPPQAELTHGLRIDTKVIGLTAAEAQQIDSAIETYKTEARARIDAAQAEHMARIHAAAPNARTWEIRSGDGYNAGETCRVGDDVVTVLRVTSRYISEDGMSLGLMAESGRLYTATVRLATDEEAASILEAEERQQRREELLAQARRAFGWLYGRGNPRPDDAERPAEISPDAYAGLPRVALGRLQELYVDEAAGVVWSVTRNSADGDDWGRNNAPGFVVYRQPLTPERQRIIQGLRDTT